MNEYKNITTDDLFEIYKRHPIISTDSRKISENSIFFALKGELFDGNKYAEAALDSGAAYAVIDDVNVKKNDRYLLVDDVLSSLQLLATMYRGTLDIPVIAITGSNGKTTTKELCREVLQKKFNTKATIGNLNNHIGVPLTILSTPADTEMLIVEMGANHQGEIDALCTIAKPDYVMITNIGKAHMEGFGGVAGIKRGKSEMYRYAAKESKSIFINQEDEVLISLLPENCTTIPYTPSQSIEVLSETPTLRLRYKDIITDTNIYGIYNLPNIGFAIACGHHFGVDDQDIMDAIGNYISDNNRSQTLQQGKNTYIKDAYNANPTSMKVSIESFLKIDHPNKWMILGDMLELGAYAEQEHLQIIKQAHTLGAHRVIFVGPIFGLARKGHAGHFFSDIKDAKQFFDNCNIEEGMILLKGSRGLAIERIIGEL
ncbi:MAG: UDP-N-acetylmuramoyl-tripeptide--D-alanyl-D-alanine ligase [Saprospiraceae bacterium]